MAALPRVGIVATSSAVPEIELELGTEHLRSLGFEVAVHPDVLARHFTFAGTDEQRLGTITDFATDPAIDVLWCARGGYGAGRLLPLLDAWTDRYGPPPRKMLIGYSDVTVLHEYVRARWGWATLHAPMPAATNFPTLSAGAWPALLGLVVGTRTSGDVSASPMEWLTPPPPAAFTAELVGGNLALWCSLAGTRYQPSVRGRILFLEDIGEPFYRLDRMMTQLVQASMLDGAAAIVLGDFTNCADETQTSWANREGTEKRPLRNVYDDEEGFREIFGTVGRKLGIPVAKGLPVGHGPNFNPLPLGAEYALSREGRLELLAWDWLNNPS